MNMEQYVKEYDTLEKKIVYDFRLGFGGIGDLTKFYMFLLNVCIKHKLKIHYLVNNIPAERYLKLVHPKMYITKDVIRKSGSNCRNLNNDQINDIASMNTFDYYFIAPFALYKVFEYNDITIPLNEIFYFTNEVITQSIINKSNYISLHLRMGDKYLETDKAFVCCKEDTRSFNQADIDTFIERQLHLGKTIVFACDNNSFKQKMKKKYDKLVVTQFDIGHTSFANTTDSQVLDTMKEFYVLANSEEIFMASDSGFPRMASKFYNIPISQV